MKGYAYDPEKQREASRRSHLKHKKRRNAAMREAAWNSRGLLLSMEEWEAFLLQYGERCEYPGCPETEVSPDHDHSTGELRGILCRKHNRALGMFGDCKEGLQKAIDYLNACEQRNEGRREASVAS